MGLPTPDFCPEDPKTAPIIWRWGPWPVSMLSAVFYFAIILVQMGFGIQHSPTWPLWASDYTVGAYPLLWLVYICLPLFVRDIWICQRLAHPWPRHIKWSILSLTIASLPIFKWVYGWY